MEKQYQLPKEFADKWLTALRSGEYRQGSEMLKTLDDEYCCLGLACEISGIHPIESHSMSFPFDLTKKGINISTLPELLQEDCNAEYNTNQAPEKQTNFNCRLAAMNDTGSTFPEIADWIEENVEFI